MHFNDFNHPISISDVWLNRKNTYVLNSIQFNNTTNYHVLQTYNAVESAPLFQHKLNILTTMKGNVLEERCIRLHTFSPGVHKRATDSSFLCLSISERRSGHIFKGKNLDMVRA